MNLALHVLRRRADGYHELDTAAFFCGVGDRVEVADAASFSLEIAGPFAGHAPAGTENLVARATGLMGEAARRLPAAAVRLSKRLPAGAGFGGGSADAAATLHALNRLWRCGYGVDELAAIGVSLGADVPMALRSAALRARGIGERIALLPQMPPLPILLVWPGVTLSTARVFAALEPAERPPLPPPPRSPDPEAALGWIRSCRNDLEAPAIAACPAIGEALGLIAATEDCRLARMSGSGSGCFGLYGSAEAAEAARVRIAAERPDWWSQASLAA